jgi:UDP-N-acetylmuramoylalanine--D-glutamate ligase
MSRANEVQPPQQEEHRQEFVARRGGITFINNALSFSCNTCWYSFETYDNIVWITTSVDKMDKSCAFLRPIVFEKVSAIICIGEEANSLHLAFNGLTRCIIVVSTVREALQYAMRFAEDEDTVLLSPLCATNHAELGQQFKKEVFNLNF